MSLRKALLRGFSVVFSFRSIAFVENPTSIVSNDRSFVEFSRLSFLTSLISLDAVLFWSKTSFLTILLRSTANISFSFRKRNTPRGFSDWKRVRKGLRSRHIALLNSQYAGKMTEDVFLKEEGSAHLKNQNSSSSHPLISSKKCTDCPIFQVTLSDIFHFLTSGGHKTSMEN